MSENGSMLDESALEPIPDHEPEVSNYALLVSIHEIARDVAWLRSRVESMEAGMRAALEQPTMQAMMRNFGIEIPSPPDK